MSADSLREFPERVVGLGGLYSPFYSGANPIRSLAGQDITNTSLANRDLSGLDFHGANQWSAHQYGLGSSTDGHPEINVSNSVFNGACLDDAQLCEVIGDYVCFCRASFQNADLKWAVISGACFIEANLTSANLRWIKLRTSNFSKAVLSGARFDEATLTGTCFSRSKFSLDTSFKKTGLTNCCFRDTNLRNLLGDGDILFPDSEVAGVDFRVDQTIAGARLPRHIRLDLQKRGAIIDPLSDEDPDASYFYEGYFE